MRDYGPALTWNELADLYDQHCSGRKARTQKMETIYKWAVSKKDLFYESDEGTLHLLYTKPSNTN